MRPLRWAVGVTTVPQRRHDLLPRTLLSLRAAGWMHPHLFVDGSEDLHGYQRDFGGLVTVRQPALQTYGNWVLALAELLIREPACHRYAIFQDDCVAVRSLRAYLERCPMPERSYLNLYTFPAPYQAEPPRAEGGRGYRTGWYRSNQNGKGAVGLVFSREGVVTLLTHQHMVERPLSASRAWQAVDGAIVTAMGKAGWTELVHHPSPLQHTGLQSTMGNVQHARAPSFPGEDFDAMKWLEQAHAG